MSVRNRVLILVAIVVLVGIALVVLPHRRPSGGLQAAFDAEFLTRPDGYQGLSERYGFRFPAEPRQMDPGLMYRAVADGAVDVIDGFATDGRIKAYNLVILEDDKGFFPPYYAAPLVRDETLEKYPALEGILNRLAGKMSDEAMQRLNYEVDEKGRKAYNVAREFLVSERLVDDDAERGDGSRQTVVIGGKQFTEQEILGELMAILIEHNSKIRVIRKLNLGGTMICFNALKSGDLDLYPEYTGTGLVNILKSKVIADPDKAYQTVKEEFKRRYGLSWLEPFGFNNAYTLTMRRDHAKRLGIETISDLARVINAEQDGT